MSRQNLEDLSFSSDRKKNEIQEYHHSLKQLKTGIKTGESNIKIKYILSQPKIVSEILKTRTPNHDLK